MKLDNLYIVFVGESRRGSNLERIAETRGWTVQRVTELMPALAECAFLTPDIVILDNFPETDLTKSVYFHLRSIEYGPFLALHDAPNSPRFASLNSLSFFQLMNRNADPNKMIESISNLVIRNRISKSRKHFELNPEKEEMAPPEKLELCENIESA